MKFLMKKINMFCYKHPRFGIPNLMLYIAVANLGIYLIDLFGGGFALTYALAFVRNAILRGQVWRIVTFILLPLRSDVRNIFGELFYIRGSGLLFVILAGYFYYWIGSLLEREWGLAKFTVFYLSGIILNILVGFVAGYTSMYYVNLSMFFSFAVLFPDMTLLLFFILPVKAKWLALINAGLFLWDIATAIRDHNLLGIVLPVVAILNFLIFFWGDLIGFLRRGTRARRQARKNTVNFKQEVRRIKYEQKTKPYSRKCEVCGRTDVSDPTLEFRYCSRCQGYHCFCIDHINSHQHFTE